LWRENIAIGRVERIVRRRHPRDRDRRQRCDLLRHLGGFCGFSLGLRRRAIQKHVVDHLVEINRDLFVAYGLRHLGYQPARALRDLNEVDARLREFFGKGSREHRIRIVVVVGQTIERGLAGSCGKHREHAFRQLRHRRETTAAGDGARSASLERIVAAGIEHQDGGAHLLVLQPLDDAVGQDRCVAHQFFLTLGRRRHIGRQQEILPRDLKAEKKNAVSPGCRMPAGSG
jgi:hypothetical protein